jgi:hypothetical protein
VAGARKGVFTAYVPLLGDHFRNVGYDAIQNIRADVVKAEPTTEPPPPPNLLEPGDLVSVTTPAGTFLECVVVESPTVTVALDDGRTFVARLGQLSDLRPGAGRDRLRALQPRIAVAEMDAMLSRGCTACGTAFDPPVSGAFFAKGEAVCLDCAVVNGGPETRAYWQSLRALRDAEEASVE